MAYDSGLLVQQPSIEIRRRCSSPSSFCVAATKGYIGKLGTRLRVDTSPLGREAFPDIWWSVNVIATPNRQSLIHGRVPDEFAIALQSLGGAYPSISASVRFEPLMLGSQLHLSGWYESPFSLFGSVIDQLVGPWLIRASAERFLDELAASIELQFERFCAGIDVERTRHG